MRQSSDASSAGGGATPHKPRMPQKGSNSIEKWGKKKSKNTTASTQATAERKRKMPVRRK